MSSSERERRIAQLAREGSAGADEEDRAALLRLLDELGASEGELEAAARTSESTGALAMRLALGAPGGGVSFNELGRHSTLPVQEAISMWRALGFPDVGPEEPVLDGDLIAALEVLLATTADQLDPDTTTAIARVAGTAAARLAQTIVDAYRVDFEVPLREAGTPYSEIVGRYSVIAQESLPMFLTAFAAIFREHLLRRAAGVWSYDGEDPVATRDLVVSFADLAGYTSLSRTLTGAELAALVQRFERVLYDAAPRHRTHLVKLIGDGAMAVSDTAQDACAFALDLVEAVTADDQLPPVRVSLAAGSVVSLGGDYYGNAVNVAARLLAIAERSQVVADELAREAAHGSPFVFEPLEAQALKGIPSPVQAYRVARPAGAGQPAG